MENGLKIKFKRQPLLDKISTVIGLTESNSPNELLKNVLMRGSTKKKQCFIAATDLQSTIVSFFTKEEVSGADFDVLIPAHKFLDIVKQIQDEEVEINIHKNDWVEIKLPFAQFKFPCLPGKDFPKIPHISAGKGFKVPVASIANMLPSVLNFSSSDMLKRNLNGVLFEPFEGKIRFVATDGHRLAYFQKQLEGGADFEKAVVPRKAVGEIAKVLRSCDSETENIAEFSFDEEKVFFKVGQTTVVSTPVDSPFPDYARVIPDISSIDPVAVDKNAMLGAVRRVGVFCSDPRKMDLEVASSSLSLKSGQTEGGEGNETVTVQFKGEEVKASFNPDFLSDSLNFLDGETVEFRPGDGNTPAVFTLPDTQDFFCVVMPVVS